MRFLRQRITASKSECPHGPLEAGAGNEGKGRSKLTSRQGGEAGHILLEREEIIVGRWPTIFIKTLTATPMLRVQGSKTSDLKAQCSAISC